MKKGWVNTFLKQVLDFYHLISYIYRMKEKIKKVTITSKNITPKQWSLLLLELNLVKQAWRPYATLDLSAPGLKKVIRLGTRRHDQQHAL